jgi:hypothetical protein
MGSSQSNNATITQDFYNNVLQENQESCTLGTKELQDNNTIIISGGQIDGNFTGITNASTTDSTCLLVGQMQNSIDNILSASLQQTNKTKTDWFNGFQFNRDSNTFNIKQSVTNNISQINQQTCSSNIVESSSGNYIYFGDSLSGNFIGISNTSNSHANCSITNAMKNQTYNRAQASGNQNNAITGMFVAIMTAIIAMIGLVTLLIVGMFSVGGIGAVGYKLSHPDGTGATGTEEQQDILAEQQLGISSQDLAVAEAHSHGGPILQSYHPLPNPGPVSLSNVSPAQLREIVNIAKENTTLPSGFQIPTRLATLTGTNK